MLNANPEDQRPEMDDSVVERIVQTGGRGALALVAIATAVVVAVWFAFYFFVFIPRSPMP